MTSNLPPRRGVLIRRTLLILVALSFFALHYQFAWGAVTHSSSNAELCCDDSLFSYDSQENLACDEFDFDYRCAEDRQSWTGFFGIDGSKQPQDLGVNAHLGGRVAIQYGRLLDEDFGFGLQVGTAIHGSANAVQVTERIQGTTDRFQSFSTLGFFQRLESGWSWAGGYDMLYQDYYDQSWLGQWRMQANRRVSEWDEFGIGMAIGLHDDQASFLNDAIQLKPLDYGRLSWRRYWKTQTYTSAWIGIAESHSETNVALGDFPAAGRQFLFGADLRAPLNGFMAIYGEANFLMPSNTGAVDAFLGIEFTSRRRRTVGASSPLLPLAGNPSFIIDGRR